jgi:hypothetical protein
MRTRPSYANIVSTLALVVALGGSGAYAAGLAKNSVTTKQIKNGTVKAVDVKQDALTGAVVKESTLGTVPSAAKLDGLTHIQLSKPENPTSTTPFFTRGSLQLSFYCDFAPTSASIRVSTTADNAALVSDNIFDDDDFDSDFDVADSPRNLATAFGNGDAAARVDFSVLAADGTHIQVSGMLLARDGTCKADLHILG